MSGPAAPKVAKDLDLVGIAVGDHKPDGSADLDGLKEEGDVKAGNPVVSQDQEEEIIKKKYGGLLPKKHPLISKDHERAFFDSADWALGKGAGKPKGPLEALRPKLQPTPHLQARRSAYAPADGHEEGDHGDEAREDSNSKQEKCGEESIASEEKESCPGQSNKTQPSTGLPFK